MSLKTRLRVLIIVLIVTIVVALSILNIDSVVHTELDDVLARADLTAQQVQATVQQRLTERAINLHLRSDDPAEAREAWTKLVATDPVIPPYLLKTLGNGSAFVEIVVESETGRVISSSEPSHLNRSVRHLPDFEHWIARGLWPTLSEVLFAQDNEYVVSRPLSVVGQDHDLFVIRVIISTALLSKLLEPGMVNVALVSSVCLIISLLLAILVSNLALQPLALIGARIDEIAAGKLAKDGSPPGFEQDEIATVQHKLSELGAQYSGARQDAAELRSNIDLMLQRLEEAVLLFDAQGVLIMAGRPAERLLGIAHADLIGKHYELIFPSYTAQGGLIQQAIRKREPLADYPITLERGGLPTMRLLVNLEHLEKLPATGASGMIITLRDADTRRELESQLDISSRLVAINRLTSGVAHEVRNPLNAITLHLEVLKTKLEGQEVMVAAELETISREISRLDKVVRTFLDFTRPVKFTLRAVNLHDLAVETISLVEPQARQRQVEIENLSSTKDAVIQGDWDSLKQALLNVIINGIEAMESTGKLSLNVQEIFDECVVTIRDEGAGIPPEVQDKVFNLYFTTKEKGSGIGLAVTFQVVQLHSGNIDFTSEKGKGTQFRIRFPSGKSRGRAGTQTETQSK